MKPYCLVTTFYSYNSVEPDLNQIKQKINYDGKLEDLYVNFNNTFDPWHKDHLNVGASGRKDLIYGKIFLLKEFIQNYILNKYEYICHVDFSDVKFARSFTEMMNAFMHERQDFIISTEKTCWPYLNYMQSILPDVRLEDKEFEYINSGAIISKTAVFYNVLIKLIDLCLTSNIDFWDDQGVWQYYNLAVEKLNSDKTSKYFFSTALLDESYYSLENKQIKTKFGTYPYIIHDNSSFSLNLIDVIGK